MGRPPRILGENLCYHVRVQCNYNAFFFGEDEDFSRYLDIIQEVKLKTGFLLHHYVLMNTHVHLILTTPGPTLLDSIMRLINHRYAIDYHKRYRRHGHFWIGSYGASIIETDNYALACMRYLDRNPLRAKMVTDPKLWQWSSHCYYALGEANPLITPHVSYLGLANDMVTRQKFYHGFIHSILPSDETRDRLIIRHSIGLKRKKKR